MTFTLDAGRDLSAVVAEQPDPLTGIHLMRSGEVRAHLPSLVGEVSEAPARLPGLVAAKEAAEHGRADVDLEAVRAETQALHGVLDEAQAASKLPDEVRVHDALHDLVVRVRLEHAQR